MRKLLLVVILSLTLFACKKEHNDNNLPPADGLVVSVNINPYQKGYAISPTFEGLSFETAILTKNPEYLNENNSTLIQLIKNLGPGILRIGGDTSDETEWTGKPRDPNTPTDVLTTSDIDRLSAFSKASGWQVLYGLNLGNNNVSAAANEALYVSNSVNSNLYAIQFGNEPDIYHMFGLRSPDYGVNNFITDWDAYYSAVKSVAPQAAFAGPDVANNSDWVEAFAQNRKSKVKLLDAHYYITGPASSPAINYHNLLDENFFLQYYLQKISAASTQAQLPFRMTECNSIYGGGKAGASDVFAASLWSLDFMWQVAENGGQGVNFHDGHGLIYSPILMSNGVVTAMPEYYAMLAFKYGSTDGRIIPATIDADHSNNNCNVYACANADGTMSVTLINKETTKDFSFKVRLTKQASSIDVVRLTAPSVTSTTGITFAGKTVSADGNFTPSVTEQYTVNQNNFTVNVKAGSAAVVTVH